MNGIHATRARVVGMTPGVRPATLGRKARACKICNAAPGEMCVIWKTDKGERIYKLRTLKNMHRER